MENYRSPGGTEARVARLVGAVMERCQAFFSSKNVEGREEGNESPEKALGEAAIEACTCHLYEIAAREGLLGADEERPVITIEGEKFNVPDELVDWLHSKSLRARDLRMRKDAWRKLADLFWKQESRIKELLTTCTDNVSSCAGVDCREHLEVRQGLLDKLWHIASEQRIHAKLLSKDPIDAPYASCIYRP